MMFPAVRLRAVSLLAVLLTACVAALLAHFAIDGVGDVALAHDAYDGVSHGSRAAVLVAAVVLALGAAFRLVLAAGDSDAGAHARVSRALARLVPRSPVWFVATVIAAATAVLVCMAMLDSFVATGATAGLADALGGSIRLGLGIEIPIAAAVAALAWHALRWLAASSHEIVRVIATLFAAISSYLAPPSCLYALRVPVPATRVFLAHRVGKRGPPVSSSYGRASR